MLAGIMAIVVPLLLLILNEAPTPLREYVRASVVVVFGLLLIFMILVGIGFKPVYLRIARTPGKSWMFEVHHYVEFDNEFVHANYENGYHIRIPWNMILKVGLTPDHILLYIVADAPMIVPRASLPDSAAEQRLFEFLSARNLVAIPFPPRTS